MCNKEKMVDRIKKLLALAGNNPNPNEAKLAMERANKLLKANDMSMTSILDVENEEIGESSGKNVQYWTKHIYNSVSELYHCNYFTSRIPNGRSKQHNVVGTESNRTTTMLICAYLIKSITKESKTYPKYQQTTFKNGASMGISKTCQDLIDKEEADTNEVITGTGLVPVDIKLVRVKANTSYTNDKFNLTTGRASSARGSQSGYDYGSSLSVNPQLSGRKAIG